MKQFQEEHSNAAEGQYFPGLDIFEARLMSPHEVQVATQHYPAEVRRRVHGRWSLCGDLHAAFVAEVERRRDADFVDKMSAIRTPLGFHYAIFTHQLGAHAHRFLLPAFEPDVAQFVKLLKSEPFMFSLGKAGGGIALLLDGGNDYASVPTEQITQPLAAHQVEAALLEWPKVVLDVTRTDFSPSLNERAIQTVGVSVVAPVATFTQYRRSADTAVH